MFRKCVPLARYQDFLILEQQSNTMRHAYETKGIERDDEKKTEI